MPEQQTVVLTGASDGIGAAAARQLAERGYRVVVVGRSAGKTAAVAGELDAPFHLADFADLAQVRTLAEQLHTRYPRIDVLVNNAGGTFDRETTVDGFEKTFQVNHLAPFLLTHLLMDQLLESEARVVSTSSIGHRLLGDIDLEDLNNTRDWNANKAYGDAKLANVLFTRELHRRYSARGIAAVAFHPGGIATNFANDTSSVMRLVYQTPLRRLLSGADKGGQRLVWLVEGTPGQTWQSGEYYERNKPGKVNPQAHDADLARGLWERSEAMLGL